LLVRHTERHWFLRVESYSIVILPDRHPDRESNLRGLWVRGHAKDTSHLGAHAGIRAGAARTGGPYRDR